MRADFQHQSPTPGGEAVAEPRRFIFDRGSRYDLFVGVADALMATAGLLRGSEL